MDLHGLFSVYNSGVWTVENNKILTHLFNARKASLARGVRSFCSNINPELARIVIQTDVIELLARHLPNKRDSLSRARARA
jgi:anti-anti-sigma regulatory factor